jgi:hypothetical protein
MSYATPFPVAVPWEMHAPVPGWGFTPNLAGPRTIGVGETVEEAVAQTRAAEQKAGIMWIGMGLVLGLAYWIDAARSKRSRRHA